MSLNDAVIKKLRDEFSNYMDYLSELSPSEVVEEAHKIVVKAGFLDRFQQGYITNENQLSALMQQEQPLDTLYHDWLKTSLHFEEILEGSIDYSMEKLDNREKLAPAKQPSMAEVLREAQAKADKINAQNVRNKSGQRNPSKTNPELGE